MKPTLTGLGPLAWPHPDVRGRLRDLLRSLLLACLVLCVSPRAFAQEVEDGGTNDVALDAPIAAAPSVLEQAVQALRAEPAEPTRAIELLQAAPEPASLEVLALLATAYSVSREI